MFSFFFFSSRRRHTRWNCDWSSDVCSSDLRHAATKGVHASAHRYQDCRVSSYPKQQVRSHIGHGPGNRAKQIRYARVASPIGKPAYHIRTNPPSDLTTQGAWTESPSGPAPDGASATPRRAQDTPSGEVAMAIAERVPSSLAWNM